MILLIKDRACPVIVKANIFSFVFRGSTSSSRSPGCGTRSNICHFAMVSRSNRWHSTWSYTTRSRPNHLLYPHCHRSRWWQWSTSHEKENHRYFAQENRSWWICSSESFRPQTRSSIYCGSLRFGCSIWDIRC